MPPPFGVLALQGDFAAHAAAFGDLGVGVREVRPRQPSLGLLDAVIERNAWGRQVDSFEARVDVAAALGGPMDAVFIRAPRFLALFPDVEVLARYAGEPVLVRQGRVVAATFHPELTRSRALHRYLVALASTRHLRPPASPALPARPPAAAS